MLAKDVRKLVAAGTTEFAGFQYVRQEQGADLRAIQNGRFDRVNEREMEELTNNLRRYRVEELDVQNGYRQRPGVRVTLLDEATGEVRVKGDRGTSWSGSAGLGEPFVSTLSYVQLAMPWEQWEAAHHDYETDREEVEVRRRREREQEMARRQERAAKDWMERAFQSAAATLVEVAEYLHDRDGEAFEHGDADVRALVERRHPRGNPYLNGEREA